ncbi:MAG TPA: ABC transporter [Firmicutes bacterium]|nr:ABC transporter [Bacillota bacterium]
MVTLTQLVRRNVKLFFKDKIMFFSSMITPIILLVLYVTFLRDIYFQSVKSFVPEGVTLSNKIANGIVGNQLMASLLSVICVTVAFSSNMLMVQDKTSGVRKDFTTSPVKNSTLSLAYFISSLFSTLLICYFAMFACFIYIACIGWYLSFLDVILIIIDVFLLTFFGTTLSSIINVFLKTQGQISAVATIISAGYGFISGAYMPLSQYNSGLRNVLMFLPGTYGTSLIKNHSLQGSFEAMEKVSNMPIEAINEINKSVDCTLVFFGNNVPQWASYLVMLGAISVLMGIYILINKFVKQEA